ncbi:helix-turn-helix domain-containing protein [Streptomyces xiaopingdaonensis]|uniref:helix-turn-helix domain-containing protein n=1 Tax=Streptomyces xiaopingdaonensis TaxID=1565415 RepID=UPI00030393DC
MVRTHAALQAAVAAESTLHRRFRAQLGTTPHAWLARRRAALARRLPERSGEGLDAVARRSGPSTPANLRTVVRRTTGLTPGAYRARFGEERTVP